MEKSVIKPTLSGFAYFLVKNNLLDEEVAIDLMKKAHGQKKTFIVHLAEQELLASSLIAKQVATYFGMPLFDIDSFNSDYIPPEFINSNLVQKRLGLPLFKKGNSLCIAVADPTLPNLQEINFLTGLTTSLVIVRPDRLNKIIDDYFGSQLLVNFDSLEVTDLEDSDLFTQEEEVADTALDHAPVVRYINKILADAIRQGASDIHFEPYEKFYRIRYRQDGILTEIANPPLKLANYLVARLKVMANLDLSERRIPQDGRFKLNLTKTQGIDFRVSTCPTLWGEKVVMRILDSSNALLDIDVLGFEDFQKEHIMSALQRSQGMILVTGPTGSGKTVTLYTSLKILNTMEKNTSTVEDPVEINLPGINQVQVNSKTGLTFAAALRSFLRQDPDIIMVGEIRDLETAEIAVKASQTGHLVLSTLHTNSAPETLTRLSNMGVASYNIASSINLIIAQRLLRKLCPHCKKLLDIPKEALLSAGFTEEQLKGLKIYGPQGCTVCNSGYKGRVGIYEVMPISEALQRVILESGKAIDIAAQARQEGVINLRQSGLLKVAKGLTSLDEVNRVT